jgi:hypothetical protein
MLYARPSADAPDAEGSVRKGPAVDDQDAEPVRLRIATAIGRDSSYITSADKTRHLDAGGFALFYGGQLWFRKNCSRPKYESPRWRRSVK